MQMKAFPDRRFGSFDVRDEHFDNARLLEAIFRGMIIFKAEHLPWIGGYRYHAAHPSFEPVEPRCLPPTYGAVVKEMPTSLGSVYELVWVKDPIGNWKWE